MDEERLIYMVADHEGRMTTLEQEIKERRTDFENQVLLNFEKIFGRLKNIEEEMGHMSANIKRLEGDMHLVKNHLGL